MRVIRSKPVMILAATGLAKKLKDRKDRRNQHKRARVGKTITGLALVGATGGAIRYFTDSARGNQRRQKILGFFRKSGGNAGDGFSVNDTSPATGL